MKLMAFFITIIVVTSSLRESKASGIGGIYGQAQRNRLGRGKVIESTDKEKTHTYSPKQSVESAKYHAKPKENYNEDGKFKHRVVHA